MSARIEKLIGQATLQGMPLSGYRRFGVPPGGAFDQESFRLGNVLLDNEAGAFAIELSNASIQMSFNLATRIALVGAPVHVEHTGRVVPVNALFDVPPKGTLTIAAPRKGLCTYLCVSGGWTPPGVDSLLGRSGRRLSAGDVLDYAELPGIGQIQRLANVPMSIDSRPLRVLPGTHDWPEEFSNNLPLTVSINSDRTGIRIDGLSATANHELPSEPACVGAIQLTPSGQLIVIGPDGPTIGGYPKVGVVCEADIDRLAHLRPGDTIEFERIDLAEAHRIAQDRTKRLEHTIQEIRLARE